MIYYTGYVNLLILDYSVWVFQHTVTVWWLSTNIVKHVHCRAVSSNTLKTYFMYKLAYSTYYIYIDCIYCNGFLTIKYMHVCKYKYISLVILTLVAPTKFPRPRVIPHGFPAHMS